MASSHTNLAKFIHWSFILLYLYGLLKQVDDLSELEDNSLLIFETIFATIFLIIVLMRYFYMRRFETMHASNVPVHKVHKLIAKTVHRSMYICLILLPLSGLMMAYLYTQGITDGPLQLAAIAVHETSATLSYVLIIVHISAAIYSRIKGEGVWSSMVPILKEKGPNENELVKRIADFENRVYDKIGELVPFSESLEEDNNS